ncbi:MAG TPA: amidase [Solirubrobacteraceae bacterium]|nr:amidase [Solirubrobacteraceae bacterium]
MTAGELLAAFASRERSPVEVLEECAARIASADAQLGAFAALCLDRARAEAQAAEGAWRRGEPTGPLCGLPLAVKDVFDTAGVETACGSAILAGRVPARDAEAVRRARAAGAILIGKTRTHEFAWGYAMTGAHGEPLTRNPRDPERMPGGSSGGSAAALAAGMAVLALGTDTGGSIRLPAAWCGVCGHKPTFGLVPMDGVWPLAPSLDHAGPMALTPGDCALLLHALGGPAPAPLPDELRIGGAALLPDAQRTARVYRALLASEALAVHRRAGLWPARAADYTPAVRRQAERAESAALGDAPAERERLRAELSEVFAAVDLIVSPVAAVAPPRWDEPVDLREAVTPHLALQDLLGLPACALPTGEQVTGPPGSDALVLAYAETRLAGDAARA